MADRDDKGRFIKGGKGGPGRPRGEREYREALIGRVSLEEWGKVVDKMVGEAISGNVKAFQALAPYIMGLPVQKLQLNSSDTALLAELLEMVKARGVSPAEILQSMMDTLAEMEDQQADNYVQ